MEQFYYFAADGRRNGPLPLSILKKLAQGEQIAPETTLEAEDGRRFRADKKLDAADFGGRTTEAPRSVRATRRKRRSALEERDAEDDRRRVDEKLPVADFSGRATAKEVGGASEKRRFGNFKISRLAFYLAYVGILGVFGVFLTICGVLAAFKNCLKRLIAAPPSFVRGAFGASENNESEPTAPNERKRGVAKVLRLAAGVGLATTICVMGVFFLGGWITIILVPIIAPILAFAGCFDAKINRIDESEEETEEAERGVSKHLRAEKNSEKAVEKTGDAAPSGTSDETKADAAMRRGVWLALTGAALFGVAVVSSLAASTGEADVGGGVSALSVVLALICLALACGELISSLILRA